MRGAGKRWTAVLFLRAMWNARLHPAYPAGMASDSSDRCRRHPRSAKTHNRNENLSIARCWNYVAILRRSRICSMSAAQIRRYRMRSRCPHRRMASQPIKSLDELETEAIQHALNFYHGNRRHAANALGISERSLYRKLKEKGLEQI